jgi:hypothetical protein
MLSAAPQGFSILMDAAEVEAVFTIVAENFPRYVNSWLVQSATITKEEMAGQVNQGVGALMGGGIQNNIDAIYNSAEGSVMVKPNKNVPYADSLETGSDPHYVPHGPDSSLAQWAELKGLNVFAIAATIAKIGTRPHPFVAPTYDVVKGPVAALFGDGVAVYLSAMGVL